MKRLILLFVTVLLFNCSKDSDGVGGSVLNPPEWIQGQWRSVSFYKNKTFGIKETFVFTQNNITHQYFLNDKTFNEKTDDFGKLGASEEKNTQTEYLVKHSGKVFYFKKIDENRVLYNADTLYNQKYLDNLKN